MAEKNKPDMQKAVETDIKRQSDKLKAEGKKTPKERGTYDEAPGGGTPAKGGGRGVMKKNFEVVDSKEEAEQIRKDDPNAVIRYNQPRDENGQFTYNSANNKPLSTETSRGHTLPPFLKGIDLTFIKKGSEFKYADENGKLVHVISSIDMSADEMKAMCMKYFETEGGFAAIVGTAITKLGRKSNESKNMPEGKLGDLDVSTLSQSTQNKLNEAAQLKDQEWLNKQIAQMAKTKTVSQPTIPTKPVVPSTAKTPVGVGAPMSKPEVKTQPTNIQKDPNKKIFTETSKKFDDKYKAELKNNPKKWISENKDKIKKAIAKNPNLTPGAIANAIYSGKVSKWDDLL